MRGDGLRAAVVITDRQLHQLAGALLADQSLRPRRGEIALDLGERLLGAIGLVVLALHPLERPLHAQLRLGRPVRDDGKVVLRAGKPVELGGRLVDAPGGGVDLDAADGGDLHNSQRVINPTSQAGARRLSMRPPRLT